MPQIAQIWPGRNCISCFCCISGPSGEWYGSMCWYIASLICVIIVSIFATPLIWNQVSPILPLAFYASILLTTLFKNLTSCTDPGIIPRRPFIQKMKQEIKGNSTQQTQLRKFYESFLDIQLPPSGDQAQPLAQLYQKQFHRYCQTCHIFRPPRASHCGICNNCVLVFDHHCGFINNCIGMRNYRFFVLFLIGVFLSMILFVVNMIIFGIVKAGNGVSSVIIIIICSIGLLVVGGPLVSFLGYHFYLMIRGKTTREALKKIDNSKQKQNSKILQNLWCSNERSMIDVFEQIPQQQFDRLNQKLTQIQRQTDQRRKQLREEYERERNQAPQEISQAAIIPIKPQETTQVITK